MKNLNLVAQETFLVFIQVVQKLLKLKWKHKIKTEKETFVIFI